MSVYKDPKTGKWFCMYRIKDIRGKRKQIKKTGFETKELAYQYECSMIVSNNDQAIIKRITFRTLYLSYIEHCRTKRANATIDGYNYCYNKYLKVFDNKYISSITLKDLENYRVELKTKNISVYRCNYIFKLLSRIFDFGIKYNYLKNNVCLYLDPLIDYSVKKSKVDFYTVDEFKKFISYVPSDIDNDDYVFYVAFSVLYYTGLRAGELLALDYTDVVIEKSIIVINKSLARCKNGKYEIKTTKTSSSIDNVYIPSNLLNILKVYLGSKKFKKNVALFQYNNRRLSKRTLDNKKNHYCDISGLRRIRIHDFRHSFASLIYELSNYNFSEVAKRLRHNNVSTVMKTYVHVFPNRKNEVDNKLDLI